MWDFCLFIFDLQHCTFKKNYIMWPWSLYLLYWLSKQFTEPSFSQVTAHHEPDTYHNYDCDETYMVKTSIVTK